MANFGKEKSTLLFISEDDVIRSRTRDSLSLSDSGTGGGDANDSGG